MTESTDTTQTAQNWALLMFLSIVWGGAFIAMSAALVAYQPLTVAAGRIAIGAVALVVLVLSLSPRDLLIRDLKIWRFMLLMGVLNFALPFGLLTWGLQHVPSAFAGVAMGSSPIFVLALAYVFVPDEEIGPRRVLGVVLGFVGLVVLVWQGGDASQGAQSSLAARFACIGAALCYSIGTILIRRGPNLPPLVFTAGMLAAGSLVLVPVALALEGVPNVSNSTASWALLYAGLIPTGVAFFLRVVLIQAAGPIFMSLVAYFVPIWAIILGVSLMGEALSANTYLGAAIILLGVGLTQLRLLKRIGQAG